MSLRGRRFNITLNEPIKYQELASYLKSFKSFRYILSAKEKAPTTGHEHIHIFCFYKQTISITLSKTCGSHVEVCGGSDMQNIQYIKKDGDIVEEEGELPHQGKLHSVGELQSINDPHDLLSMELKAWDNARTLNQRCKLDEIYKPNIKVYYVHGESGSGKQNGYSINYVNLSLMAF